MYLKKILLTIDNYLYDNGLRSRSELITNWSDLEGFYLYVIC